VTSLVIDCETGAFRLGLAHQLAGHLLAEHVPLAEVSASAITSVVRHGLAGSDELAAGTGVSPPTRHAQRNVRDGEVA